MRVGILFDFDNDPDVDSDNYKYSHNITTMLDNYVKWAKDKINENVLHERLRETHTPVSYDKDGNWSYMKNETFDAIVDKMKAERKGNLEDKENFRLFINRMNAETYPKDEDDVSADWI